MQHVLELHRSLNLSWISETFYKIVCMVERRRAVRQTYKELSALSDRELRDIGISRSDIRAIAEDVFEDQPLKADTNKNLGGWV